MAVVCARCGAKQGLMASLSVDLASGVYTCPKCADEIAAEKREASWKASEAEKQRLERLKQLSRKVVITTTPSIDGYKVKRYLGIESVEFVIGTGAFSEVTSSISDFFGVRSSAFEKKLRDAKQHAMESLKFLAAEKGANAVVAVDLDYTEFSGNRIALIISGTLVLSTWTRSSGIS